MHSDQPLLEVRGLSKHFETGGGFLRGRRPVVRAVDNVSFTLQPGEILAVVGESGCGKSTLGRMIVGLTRPTSGEVRFRGDRIDTLSPTAFRNLRRDIQIIFQDPFSSLNPRMRVRDIIAEPLRNFHPQISRAEVARRVDELLERVGLPDGSAGRHPHEFSGGQRQRIGIARAIASGPSLIVCDEAVSALDVSVKAQIINLLLDLQRDLGLALLFISHDLAIVEHASDRIAVMYLGKLMELGDRRSLFTRPHHPYTEVLLSAVPVPDPDRKRKRIILQGDVPSPLAPPPGCRFHTRCHRAMPQCSRDQPPLRQPGPTHQSYCFLPETNDSVVETR